MTRLALLILLARGATDEAPRSFAECEHAARERPRDLEAWRCFWILARQGHAEEAELRLAQALARAPRNDAARLYLARVRSDRGDDRAEGLFREAIAGFAARAEPRGEVFARLGLTLFLTLRGRLPEAETEVASMDRVAGTSADPDLLLWVRCAQGWQAHWKGKYDEAWRVLKEAENDVLPSSPPALQAFCLTRLGATAWALGRMEESLGYQRRQADVSHGLGDLYDEARGRGNIVIDAFRLALDGELDREEVRRLAEEALVAAQEAGNRGSQARAHLYLGDLTTGRPARDHYRRSLALARDAGESHSVTFALRALGLSLAEAEPRDPAEALRLLDEARARARGSGSAYNVALVAVARARVRSLIARREEAVAEEAVAEEAVAEGLHALSSVEAIRDRQADGVARARVLAGWTFAYHRLSGMLLAGGPERPAEDLERAFAVAERMRARVLLDELDAAQATGRLVPEGPAARERAGLLQQIAAVQRRLLVPALAGGERDRALAELEGLERAESAVRAEMARADPRFAAWRQPSLLGLAQLQRLLAEDEAMLSFQVASRMNLDNRSTEDGSWVFLHTSRGTRAHPIPDRDVLRPAVRLFRGLVERRDGSEARAAPRLYRDLLEPALRDLPSGIERLVIVPDGVLNGLPFDALRAAPDAEPLAARYATSFAPSATLWARWRAARRERAERAALVLADPDLGRAREAPAGERSFAWAEAPGRLPHARREAQWIAGLLEAGSRVALGPTASERFLKETDLTPFRLLHFATHALLDDAHPERSAVLLAPGDPSEDGLLQAREIVALPLEGRVIILAACQSASGTLLEGEGVLGLARAFFQAGAPSVVGSLWPLRDDEAEALVRGFYLRLAAGETLAGALASARRERMAAGAPAAAWAGLVVVGDGGVVPLPGGIPVRRGPGFILVGAFLLLLVLVFLRRRSRRPETPPPA